MLPPSMFKPNTRTMSSGLRDRLDYYRSIVPILVAQATKDGTDETAARALKAYMFGKDRRAASNFVSDVPVSVARNLGPLASVFQSTMYGFFVEIQKERNNRKAPPTPMNVSVQLYLDGDAVRKNILGSEGRSTRYFQPRYELRRFERAVDDWWPTFGKSAYYKPVMHRSQHKYGTMFHMVPGLVKLRYERGLPFVATERLILDFIGADGLPFVPERLEEDVPVPVLYFDKKYPLDPKKGFVVEYGGQFGVASKESDARKAAKMKAVRSAKKALGLD